jgi:hypothetical protein
MARVLGTGLVLLLGLGGLSAVHGAPGDPVGNEFPVSTYNTGTQSDTVVAPDAAGGFIVVWQSPASVGDTDGDGVWARRFDAAGAPLGTEFQVNTYTTRDQFQPAIVANGSQGFIVVWENNGGSAGNDADGDSVHGRLFDATGAALGSEFQVNTYTTGFQSVPAVTTLADGFVVVWQSNGGQSIQGQRFDAAGMPAGGEFHVNTYTTGTQRNATVAPLGGGFVVVWASAGSSGTDTSAQSVQAQRFDAASAPVGGQFQVNAYTNSDQGYPAVFADGTGGFVVQWYSMGSFGTDTDGLSVQVRRFDAEGVPQSAEFQVNTYTTGNQFGYTLGPDGTGGFVVVWESAGSPGTDTDDDSIQARRFNADWQPVGDQFQVNSDTTGGQNFPGVALDGAGGFVIAWRSGDPYGDIRAQRFEGTSIATTTTTPPPTASTTSTTLPPGEALDGRKLDLATKPGRADKSKLSLLAKDASLTLGRGNESADDPVAHGGALTISSSVGEFGATHDLVGGWKYVGKLGQGRGYKWKSRSAPIRKILVRTGKLIIAGQGAALGFDLDDDPNPVRVELAIGAHTYCLEFGGEAPKFKAGRLYRAKRSAAPASCP